MSSEDIYIAGRYNKYLRSLSQSPWIDKADKRIKNSVQELIEEGLKEFLQLGGSRLVFSSSGREDVDVRMLGRGRPFCFRVTQPWSEPTPNGYTFNQETLSKIQKFINKKHAGKIQVRDLQLVSRQDVAKQLREGSESKTKEYRALCCSSRPISNEEVERLNQMCEFDIEQNTPIRVLHRRTISARRRRIHKMKLEREANLKEFSLNLTRGGGVRKLIDDQDDEEINRLFVLTLITEAGTYIKEFVHGDFGRTEPNLASLLKDCDTDLIELDVMVSRPLPSQFDCQNGIRNYLSFLRPL